MTKESLCYIGLIGLASQSQSSWGMFIFSKLNLAGNTDYLADWLKLAAGQLHCREVPLNIYFCLAPHFDQHYLIVVRIWISLSINLRSKWSHYNQCSYQQAKLMVHDLGPSINRWMEWILVVPYVHSFFIYWKVMHQPQFKPTCFTTYYYNLFEAGIYSM